MTLAATRTEEPAARTVPDQTAELADSPVGAVGDSLTVAAWTAISRITGVVRGVIIAAVLGATVFANTYQFTNSLPNLVFYGLLGGSMLSSLLIPALVRHIDGGDRRATERVAGGFLGLIALGALVVTPVALLLAPVALRLTAFGDAAATGQSRTGTLLVLMLLPQIPLYGLVATASAAMNAKGRFALAAAAPAVENVGTIAVLVLVGVLYRNAGAASQAPTGELLLLGLGTTGAVAAHAAAQWWGARRVGVRLRPLPGWRDPEVRRILGRAVPSLAQAGLAAVLLLALLVVANRVAGGVVAFQLAMNFYFLPVALAATPVALSIAPRLSRLAAAGDGQLFRDTFVRGLTFALFIAVPAAAGYLAIASPIAHAIAYGGFGTDAGTALIAAAVGALGLGVLGETTFLVATYACYAREDTRTPLRAMVLQLVVSLGVASAALFVDGPAVLAVLGAALSAGTLISAGYLVRALLRSLPAGTESLGRPLLRMIGIALVMAVAVHFAAGAVLRLVGGGLGGVLAVLAAAALGALIYFGAQAWMGAPELGWISESLRGKTAGRLRGGARVRRWRRQPRYHPGVLASAALLLCCAAVGALLGRNPLMAVALIAVLGVAGWVYARPAVAAYLMIFLTPLTAGIDRGTLLPVLRPNEALAVLVAAALTVRWVTGVRTGAVRMPRLNRLDGALIALAVCGSVLPLLMMLARRREITADDLQYAIVLWKYLAVYAIVRFSITTERQAYRCLALSMAAASIVCIIAILQALDLFGVPQLLGTYYAPFGVERTLSLGRGSSTLSLAAAVADLAILNLALAVGLLLHGSRHRVLLGIVVLVCVFGTLGAGEFSTVLGLVVAMAALIFASRATRLFGYAIPLLLIAGIVMWPVIETRLLGFQSASGIPQSWIVRLRNLNTYFWPQLGEHNNWILGVQTSARVPASHEEFGYVWIESGYTWLLWGGGIPLLGAYVYFVVVALRKAAAAARRGTGIVATIGLALVAVLVGDVVLMLFDPHLTYRGAADAMFGLLALLRVLDKDPDQHPERMDT